MLSVEQVGVEIAVVEAAAVVAASLQKDQNKMPEGPDTGSQVISLSEHGSLAVGSPPVFDDPARIQLAADIVKVEVVVDTHERPAVVPAVDL